MLLDLENNIFNEILKYLTLKEIFTKLFILSKAFNFLIKDINIDINYNFCGYLRLPKFHNFTNVKKFISNNICDYELEILGKYNKNIIYLDLSGTLTSTGINIIYKNNQYLNYLNLENTLIDNTTLKNLCKYIKKLSYLNVSNTIVSDEGIDYLSNVQIYHLETQNNNLTNIGILNLKNISKLNISETFVNDDGIIKLFTRNKLKYLNAKKLNISFLTIYYLFNKYKGCLLVI